MDLCAYLRIYNNFLVENLRLFSFYPPSLVLSPRKEYSPSTKFGLKNYRVHWLTSSEQCTIVQSSA